MASLMCPLSEADFKNPDVVKVQAQEGEQGAWVARAFMRSLDMTPLGQGQCFQHIGLYVFDRGTLIRVTQLQQTSGELRERLEQLRALENGISIGMAFTSSRPIGVDTPEDLEKVSSLLV